MKTEFKGEISRNDLEKILTDRSVGRNFNMTINDLPEPSEIPGMKNAALFIIDAISKGKKGLLVGDYDCDGICATTIFMDFLRELIDCGGIKLAYDNQIIYTIPDRFKDGYGVSKNIIDYAISEDVSFIITVDNGIGAFNAIEYANENNIKVIITDHHLPPERVPNAEIIVNLKYDLGKFRFQEISGATISWYLCCMIREILDAPLNMGKWLDLVAITVISDVMPLEDINLIFFKHGLALIKNKHRNIYGKIFSDFELYTLDETNIGFKLVPMINAVGRLSNAKKAVSILLSREETEIRKGVEYFIDTNNKRKQITQQLLDLIMDEAIEQNSLNNKAIIIKRDGLHEGIVGILAGKIAETFSRPAFVFSWNRASNCWKGSGRTAGTIHLYELIEIGAEHALGFGGHAGAVGVAIPEDKFDLWKDSIVKASSFLDTSKFRLDTEKPFNVILSEIDNEFIDMLEKFKPFGMGFPMPLFKTKAWLSVLDNYKNGLHWKTSLSLKNGTVFTSFFFHDKTIVSYDKKEVLLNFTPKRVFSNKGYEIELHSTIPYDYK